MSTPITEAALNRMTGELKADHFIRASDMRALEIAANGLRDALYAADDDIREHVQVARYNLTGEMNTGDKITPPNPPLLIHAAGIEASEKRRAKIREALAAYSALQPKEPHE